MGVATTLQLSWATSLYRKVHGSKIVICSAQKMPMRESFAAAACQQKLCIELQAFVFSGLSLNQAFLT